MNADDCGRMRAGGGKRPACFDLAAETFIDDLKNRDNYQFP